MTRLAGKVAVVTGGSGGIGSAVATRFAAEGARVVALDLRPPESAAPDVDHALCDVADPAAVGRAFEAVRAAHGSLDVLVHAAAVLGGSGDVLAISPAEWSRFIDTNLGGAFFVAQAAARLMRDAGTGGRIVLVGSVNSFGAEADAAPYVASKGGVRLLAKALAVDLARHGITVNLLAPGAITVPRNAELFARADVRAMHGRAIPAGGPGTPADIAEAALFLAGDGAGYVTGAELAVDGGLLAQLFERPG